MVAGPSTCANPGPISCTCQHAIGFTTFVMVTVGVMIGRVLGAVAGKRAEIFGGVVLIGIGATILFEHLAGS